ERGRPRRRAPLLVLVLALVGMLAVATQPVAQLLADIVDRLAGIAEDVLEALGVVGDRVAGLGARARRLVAAHIGAADDAVVLTTLDPGHQLVDTANGHWVGHGQG